MTDIGTWLSPHTKDAYTYLTTTGRKTGRKHRIEIWFGHDGDRMFLMAGGRDKSDWVKNLMEDPHVTVELGSETRTGMAYVIAPDSPDDALARDLLYEKYKATSNLEDWRVRSLPVVITFPEIDT